ncbi:uncharacterized protein LOC131025366 [Salvia miltiorrhiza]|uniref:uncharacterized protein LOC131025366 n=1 Tax=Salvia miltiorrhiza TaxID=226208 RepID=UPI0025ACFC2F|nr:uncharacterized protein LOC131025366 [Salvia miltiorrhiza]
MAKQQIIVVVAFVTFFAAVGMQATAQEPNIPAAAANIAPAAAAAGVDPNAVVGALNNAAKDAAPVGGPIPEGVFKNLAPPAGGSPAGGASALGTNAAAAGAAVAAGVVGSFFFY